MATINIRLDDELKMESERVLSELGLGMTAALTIFLKTVVRTNSIPFQLEIPNKKTNLVYLWLKHILFNVIIKP